MEEKMKIVYLYIKLILLFDHEYMVWQEWKERFARLIENKIRTNLKLKENNYGCKRPYTRVTFYYGGAKFINYLSKKNPELYLDIEMLFHHMKRT